jgi:hypothetical protein
MESWTAGAEMRPVTKRILQRVGGALLQGRENGTIADRSHGCGAERARGGTEAAERYRPGSGQSRVGVSPALHRPMHVHGP